jgi:hypothetical protein
MIDCSQFRKAMLADPADASEELRLHRDSCGQCAEFAARLGGFEARLARAVRLDLPASPSPSAVALRGRNLLIADRRPWFALAASVVLAVGVATILWLAVPRTSLAVAVVSHVAHEPEAWAQTDIAVQAARLRAAIDGAGMRLQASAGLVSYAQSCAFRGYQVPHLVVQDESGPVTVMVLVHESVLAPVEFDEQGYRGLIIPVPGHGALAVLTRNQALDAAAINRIAARVQDSIVWSG